MAFPGQPDFGRPQGEGPQGDGPGSEMAARCENGHPMATADNFCTLCGSRQQAAGAAAHGESPPPGSYGPPGAWPPGPAPQPGGYPPPGPPQPGPGYWPQPGPYQPARTGVNGLAVASFVLGLVWLLWVGSVLAVVLGAISLRQIRERHESGTGLAIAGIVLGGLWLVYLVLSLAFGLVGSVIRGG